MHWLRVAKVRSTKLPHRPMLAVFPLTIARDRCWQSHCCSLGSPAMSTSFFARQFKTGAVDLPYTPVVLIATG